MSLHNAMGLERLLWQRQKEPLFFGKQVFLREWLATKLTFQIAITGRFQLFVQGSERVHPRNWHEKVSSCIVE